MTDRRNDLEKYINQIGFFGGEAIISIKIKSSFEGYYGRASESWETQYEIETNELKTDSGKIILPAIKMISRRFECLDDFCNRGYVEIKIRQGR